METNSYNLTGLGIFVISQATGGAKKFWNKNMTYYDSKQKTQNLFFSEKVMVGKELVVDQNSSSVAYKMQQLLLHTKLKSRTFVSAVRCK